MRFDFEERRMTYREELENEPRRPPEQIDEGTLALAIAIAFGIVTTWMIAGMWFIIKLFVGQ